MDLALGTSLEQWEKLVAQHQAIYPTRHEQSEKGLSIQLKSLLIPATIEVHIYTVFSKVDTSRYLQPATVALDKKALSVRQQPVLATLFGEFVYQLGHALESYWMATMSLPVVGDSLYAHTLIGAAPGDLSDVETDEVESSFKVTSREISTAARVGCTTCISYTLTEIA